jgi:hypothetical protein
MEYLILLVVVGFIVYKFKDQLLALADRFKKPQVTAPTSSPVEPPKPVDNRMIPPEAKPHLADTPYSQPNQDSITDRLFRPTAEAGAILDSRVGNETSGEAPLVPWPAEWAFTRQRLRVRCEGGYIYQTHFVYNEARRIRVMVTPTVNDPAGQNAYYTMKLSGSTYSADLGTAPKVALCDIQALPFGEYVLEFASDKTTEVWLDLQ